ncbi:HlyD family efflux transporter periplasmic adaptor subunit [bacterium]|nr:HlyD family efflux transporter periplasmic adaptor subunit [bacterium]
MPDETEPPGPAPGFGSIKHGLTLLVLPFLLAALTTGCQKAASPGTYQGYLEGEYVYVSSPYGGALRELNVVRGDDVKPGQLLFSLDPEPEAQAVREAKEKLRKAEAQLADAKKGRRPSEIAALEAQRDSTKTDLQLAEQLLQRRQELQASNAGAVSAEALDESKSRVASLRAQVARLAADIETAQLGAREDQIHAAAAEVDNAKAGLDRAEWVLKQKTQSATVAGTVHDTLYRPDEWVGPGKPVVVILPPENIKARFFVPEADLPKIKTGTQVRVAFDGTKQVFPATVNYVSTRAEFTPPVIYSQQTRSKLVYMIEAKFGADAAPSLKPGQPVDVTLQP